MSERRACPACDGKRLSEIYRVENIPVQSCILLDTRQEALDFPRHGILLKFCDDCGFIFNAIFDSDLVDYASATEESQHFSDTFNQFARQLVAEIAGSFDLTDRRTVEIGCGKGDFLRELAKATGTCGLGIDPGFIDNRESTDARGSLAFRREYFDPRKVDGPPDFIICRHTLEHIPEVSRFLLDIVAMIGEHPVIGIFFETPDAARVLVEGAFWDIYYEHCSYFTMGSHARLFRRHGIDITRLYLAYDGQYIIQYGAPGAGTAQLPVEDDMAQLRNSVASFPSRVAGTRSKWAKFSAEQRASGRRLAVWGGGSKAVSFLTTDGIGAEIDQVIDINPFKQGKFLPVSGHRVVAPEALADAPPDTVIVMNPIYLPEIRADLEGRGLKPEVVAV